MVGDSFQNDIEGAVNFGFKGVWFNRENDQIIDTEMVKTIFKFPDYLPF
jgi:FMN phosphatase YigB (HAD superfamily)